LRRQKYDVERKVGRLAIEKTNTRWRVKDIRRSHLAWHMPNVRVETPLG
jgi:hypothetical protein